jgi:hypothetical protein
MFRRRQQQRLLWLRRSPGVVSVGKYALVESDRFYCFLLLYVKYTWTLVVRILFQFFLSGVPACGTLMD